MSSMGNSILKSGDISKVILDNFGKPFNHSYGSSSDPSKYVFNGLASPDKNIEINAVHNLTYVSHFGGQVDKAVFLKEKLPPSQQELTEISRESSDGKIGKLKCFQEESVLLPSKTASGYSCGTDRSSTNGTVISRGNAACETSVRAAAGFWNQTRPVNDGRNCHTSELGSSKSTYFSRMKVSLQSESDNQSEAPSCISPLASTTFANSQTSEFHSSTVPADDKNNEPIYAESTKRKVVLDKAVTKRVGQTEKAGNKPEENANKDQHLVSNDRVLQESVTHVAARITVMAAHTEEDNRTIYLSSPDSAVGVEWACSSPSSVENLSLSPTFVWGERGQAKSEENRKYHSSLSQKYQVSTSFTVPSKSNKPDELHFPRVSSPTHTSGILSSVSHKKESLEMNDRYLASGERRQRFLPTTWSQQCRIDEEEEEETSSGSLQSRTSDVSSAQLVATSAGNNDDHETLHDLKGQKGMSKSASCPVELSKVNSEAEGSSQPPPPPPKKQPR